MRLIPSTAAALAGMLVLSIGGDCQGLPSDWYLRLAGEAATRWRQKQSIPLAIPIKF